MAMTPERIAQMRVCVDIGLPLSDAAIIECLDEIERLRSEIEKLRSPRTDSEILLEAASIIGRQPIQGELEAESWRRSQLAEELKRGKLNS